MKYWIVDNATNETIAGGLRKDEVKLFITFNKRYPLKNLVVHSEDKMEWSASAWLKRKD